MNTRRRAALTVGACCVLAVAGCGTNSGGEDDPELRAACDEFNTIVNDEWPKQYGAQMGIIGEALATEDEEAAEAAVADVRELYLSTADDLRTLAEETSHEELAGHLTGAADGLAELADGVATPEDAMASSDLMSVSAFADSGQAVAEICAG